MNGNGCAGSIDSGVSTGKTWSWKCSSSQAARPWSAHRGWMLSMPSLSSSSHQRRRGSPAGPPAGGSTSSSSCSSCCSGVRPSGLFGGDALAHLAGEAGDADHEELVEIGGRDRQEAHALEQRMVRVLRFLEDAAVELQPGELAVDEAVRDCPPSRRSAVALGGEFALQPALNSFIVRLFPCRLCLSMPSVPAQFIS